MNYALAVANTDWEFNRLVNAIGQLGTLMHVEVVDTKKPPPSGKTGRISLGSYFVRLSPSTEEPEEARLSVTKRILVWKPVSEFEPNEDAKSTTKWMELSIQTPYLRIPKWAKGPNCTDTGAVFRAPHRLTVDQKVFRQNRGKRQGSVLIDTSGSMSLSKEDVEKFVKAVPAAVIGTYGGHSQYHGAVRVLAKGGRIVTEDKEYNPIGGANGVDGPALRWLGMQPLPRVWVSDGRVTGCGDHQTDELGQIAAGICERFRIRRVHNLAQVTRLI